MAKRADHLSILFDPAGITRLPDGYADTLADHLVGARVTTGGTVALPGWPVGLVDLAEPTTAVVGPGTRIEVHVPPPEIKGALSLAVLVDASLTMGKGGQETRFEESARLLDAILLNGRSFLTRAGIVVQGGKTRHVEELQEPEGLSGASILQVTPKGTFDLKGGLQRAMDLLAQAPEGPRAVLVMTDGSEVPKDTLSVARPALHAGAPVVALCADPAERLARLTDRTHGLATHDTEEAFHFLAELAGTRASWSPPAPPSHRDAGQEEPHEFEVVIEAVES